MTSDLDELVVERMTADTALAVQSFAEQAELDRNDFASISMIVPDQPAVWMARVGPAGPVTAAIIDDGLAMAVAGDAHALSLLGSHRGDVEHKLVVSGLPDDVHAVLPAACDATRRIRDEHFMVLGETTAVPALGIPPIRVAEEGDVSLIHAGRIAALAEEYGIDISRKPRLAEDLLESVERAVAMRGVAIWVEDGRIAFTAQLASKTPVAASFGDLWVDPQLRGAGRATQGLAAFCSWLRHESRTVCLRVGVENERAIRLYERVGFTVRDRYVSSLLVNDEDDS